MDTSEKVREDRVRRRATRQGFTLCKSRRRDPHALGYGGYWLIDDEANTLIVGEHWGMSLDDVEGWLNRDKERVTTVSFTPTTRQTRCNPRRRIEGLKVVV